MNEPLRVLRDQYFLWRQNFEDLFNACQTDDQRDELRRRFATSRRNYQLSINKIFNESDQEVEDLIVRMKDGTDAINSSLQNLQNLVSVLSVITAAVKVGSSLAALGA